jgi:hypothetical protein
VVSEPAFVTAKFSVPLAELAEEISHESSVEVTVSASPAA